MPEEEHYEVDYLHQFVRMRSNGATDGRMNGRILYGIDILSILRKLSIYNAMMQGLIYTRILMHEKLPPNLYNAVSAHVCPWKFPKESLSAQLHNFTLFF